MTPFCVLWRVSDEEKSISQKLPNFVSHRQQCARSCLGIHIAYVLNNIKMTLLLLLLLFVLETIFLLTFPVLMLIHSLLTLSLHAIGSEYGRRIKSVD